MQSSQWFVTMPFLIRSEANDDYVMIGNNQLIYKDVKDNFVNKITKAAYFIEHLPQPFIEKYSNIIS